MIQSVTEVSNNADANTAKKDKTVNGNKNDEVKRKKLVPISKWNEHHEWPPIGGLRHLVFNAKKNGFDKVVRRIGRRVLIDEEAFFDWVEQQNVEVE